MISQANCELVADILEREARRAAHPLLRWLSPFRRQRQTLALIAATFSRVRGIPEPLVAQLDARLHASIGRPE